MKIKLKAMTYILGNLILNLMLKGDGGGTIIMWENSHHHLEGKLRLGL